MENEYQGSFFIKKFIESCTKDTPLHINMLNAMLIVLLSAYIIKEGHEREEDISNDSLTYEYWLKAKDSTNLIHIRDLIYDVIFPAVPKELREVIRNLEWDAAFSQNANNFLYKLVSFCHTKEDIQNLVEYIISHYYPLVITEPISTPQSINRLCMAILAPMNGTFYDGTAGIGSTCIEAKRYAEKKGGKLTIYAQEKLTVLCAVSMIRAYMNGIERFNAQSGDVLISPRYVTYDRPTQFDYSVMFPPLGQSWGAAQDIYCSNKLDKLFAIVPKSNTEWLFVQHQIASLKDKTGRGIIAVSTGTLFNDSTRHVRQEVLSWNCIECIITLPSNILPFTTSPLSLIVINKGISWWDSNAGILMVQTEKMFDNIDSVRITEQLDEQVIEKIGTIVCARKETQYSRIVPKEEIMSNDYIMLPSRYIFDSDIKTDLGTVTIKPELLQGWPILDEVSERIYRGINGSRVTSEVVGKEYKIINYADIQNGELQTGGLKTCYVTGKADPYLVQPGDILVSCKGAQIKTCVVPENMHDVLLSLNFIGIRLKKTDYCSMFLLQYLNSPVGMAYLKGRQIGTSIITLKNEDLKRMPVPRVCLEKQKKYISKFIMTCEEIEKQVQELYHNLNQEKWKLYNEMGLNCAIIRKDE
ncbi:MAG: N-6 DNA methylase [Clostridiales bacterium]|jgi:type I restriction enzyme M protein|nr:N-6 DNA methylase [Clostridiales bacterium]